jgi:serine-type D-Ala-D-Ala carboxypeptidase (penicillin-binding protein 5/6)
VLVGAGEGFLKAQYLPLLLLLALPGGAASRTVDISPATFDLWSLPAIANEQAPIALLVDLSSRQTLFARNAEARMQPASMTKAMTALVAFDLIKAGKLNEDEPFMGRNATIERWRGKGTTMSLGVHQWVTVRDLLRGVITASANDAAVVLAEGALDSEAAWLAAMNARAKSLGMNDSHFASVNGYPDGGKTYVTARDMVQLAEALIVEHPALYRQYFGQKSMLWRGKQLASRNPFAGTMPGADGIKTGHTREAGYTFLGAVEREGRRLVLVIGKAPTEANRAEAARSLAEWGYSNWDSRKFLDPEWVVGKAKVQDGAAREVRLVVPRAFTLAVPKGSNPRVVARIVYRGPLQAPINKGAVVANLEVAAIQGSHSLPLVAAEDIAKAGPIDRIVNGLLGLLE